ncbi:MAG: hypothetical protein KatS3mg009_1678 [Acidimicrobiia bacterium]|nr:MAG: hypothetical protein KatS3mg009_1678 [Acidimicrobiia bacterium]
MPVDVGTLVRMTPTSAWTPASPDPSGVTWLPAADRLMVVDSEVEEVTGAGYHGVNLWQSTRLGAVTDTGTTYPAVSKEPNGLGYIPSSNTLLISDDSSRRIHFVRPGTDQRFGTADDLVTFFDALPYSDDTEDPTYDPVSGHVFFLDGVDTEVFRIDPVNGVFGDGDDVVTHFDVGQYGITDTEALEYHPTRDTLFVGDRTGRRVIEVTKTGGLVREINLSGISGLRFVSGLTIAPASSGSGNQNLWVVDRGVDNGPDPNENDGKLFEIAVSSTDNTAPVVDSVVIDQTAPTTNQVLTVTAAAQRRRRRPDRAALPVAQERRRDRRRDEPDARPVGAGQRRQGRCDLGARRRVRRHRRECAAHLGAGDGGQLAARVRPGPPRPVRHRGRRGRLHRRRRRTRTATRSRTARAGCRPASRSRRRAAAIHGTIASGASASSPYATVVSVDDGGAPPVTDSFTWTVRPVPLPPVADAGPDQTVGSGRSFTLDASGSSDPEGGPLTFFWEQVGGPAAVIRDEDEAITLVDGVTGPATLTFRVTVTDPDGLSATDTVTVTVKAPK